MSGLDVRTMSLFFAMLTVLTNLAVLAVIVVAIASRLGARNVWSRFRQVVTPNALPIAWLVALVATVGSLYYSLGAHFVPCELCWYQRIAMYPLAVVLGVAVLRGDASVWRYAMPLAVVGGLLSVYHYQLQRFPGQGGACAAEAPCTLTLVWQFHYISIPFMALSAFAAIVVAMLFVRSVEREA